MPYPQHTEVPRYSSTIAGFGMPHGIEQEIGDLRHGGNHDRHRPLLLLPGRKFRGYPHTVGRAHTGPAELHHQQVFQLKSFPLVMRARTIFRMASSTWSMESGVESRYTASGACVSGASARVLSRWSRSFICWATVLSARAPPRARISSMRRRTRSGGWASRKILTWASGNTTVPISRPSITTLA